MLPLNSCASQNMLEKSVTLLVSQPFKSWLNETAPLNIADRLVTPSGRWSGTASRFFAYMKADARLVRPSSPHDSSAHTNSSEIYRAGTAPNAAPSARLPTTVIV